jgi:hypothetical protein
MGCPDRPGVQDVKRINMREAQTAARGMGAPFDYFDTVLSMISRRL